MSNFKLTEKKRFAIVAVAGLAAGAFLTALIDRLALEQDLEFLGIAHDMVVDAHDTLEQEIHKNEEDDSQE